jgi:acetyl-CoA acetyltransferase
MSAPSYGALIMKRHMEEYVSTVEQFCSGIFQNHSHRCINPYSQYQKEFTLEKVFDSRMICDPLIYDFSCYRWSGSGGVMCCQESRQVDFSSCVAGWLSIHFAWLFPFSKKSICVCRLGKQATAGAYEMAGIRPEYLDLVELHLAFAGTEMPNIEDLKLSSRGEGGCLAEEGTTRLRGESQLTPVADCFPRVILSASKNYSRFVKLHGTSGGSRKTPSRGG